MAKRLERSIVLWEDWSKGANYSDRLLPDGVSLELKNLDPSRSGLIEKNRSPIDAGIPTFKAEYADIEIIRFTYFYMNGVDYLVIFGKIGEHPSEPREGEHVLVIWGGDMDGEDPDNYTILAESDGYFHESVLDVQFVQSVVGGTATLRVYPVYPDDEIIPKHWWVPLRIFWREETHYNLELTVEELHRPDWTPPPDPHYDDPPGYSVHIVEKDELEVKERRLECACFGEASIKYTPDPQPCLQNDGTYWSDCAYPHFRIPFGDLLGVNDLVLLKYSANTSAVWLLSRVIKLDEDTTKKYVLLSQALKRTPLYDGVIPPTIVPDGWWGYDYALIWKVDEDLTSYDTLAEGISCLRGLPIITQEQVDNNVNITSDYYASQGTVPEDIWQCQYEKYEPIEYGFAFMTIDGQLGNMVKRKFDLPFGQAWDYGIESDKAFVAISVGKEIFPDPSDVLLTLEESQMAGAIAGLVVFRKNLSDGEWKILKVINRILDPKISVEQQSVYFDIGGDATIERLHSNGYSHQGCYCELTIVDSGQPLSETVFSFTQGLEEHDLGVELGCLAPMVYGRKMYLGNVIEIRRWDDEDDPKWHDDEVRISLFDKGEMFASEDYLGMAVGEADRVVKMVVFGRQILIFKQQRLFVLEMVGSDEINWRQVGMFEGGVQHSDHVVLTPYGVAWLSRWDLWFWDGEKKRNFSHKFHLLYQSFMDTEDLAARIGYDDFSKRLYIGGPSSSKTYVFSLGSEEIPLWTVEHNDFRPTVFVKDISGRLLFVGADGIYWAEGLPGEGIDSDTGAAWRSGPIDLGKLGARGKMYSLNIYLTYTVEAGETGQIQVVIYKGIESAVIVHTENISAGSSSRVVSCYPWFEDNLLDIMLGFGKLANVKVWKITGTFLPMGVK